MKLSVTVPAREDLRHIEQYIGQDNPQAAVDFVERLIHRCEQIAQFPGIGRRRSELKSAYRSVAEGQYIILYSVSSDTVEIERVLHGKQDLRKALCECWTSGKFHFTWLVVTEEFYSKT